MNDCMDEECSWQVFPNLQTAIKHEKEVAKFNATQSIFAKMVTDFLETHPEWGNAFKSGNPQLGDFLYLLSEAVDLDYLLCELKKVKKQYDTN